MSRKRGFAEVVLLFIVLAIIAIAGFLYLSKNTGIPTASKDLPPDGEFLVNTYTEDFQINSAVANDKDGNFVVAWATKHKDGDLYGIAARMFNSDGPSWR
jgi:hypothetical protein